MRRCDNCKYEFGEWCIHPNISARETLDRTFHGDLWPHMDKEPLWCPIVEESTKNKLEPEA